jgi:hypothetical protein
MPTIPATLSRSGLGLEIRLVQWTPLAAGDDGAPVELPRLGARSVHVRGTFGGTTVTIQGSNEATPTNWVTLSGPGGTALSFTSDGLRQVLDASRWIRPLSSGGSGATITVEMIAE